MVVRHLNCKAEDFRADHPVISTSNPSPRTFHRLVSGL
jgi:hypothetical protein